MTEVQSTTCGSWSFGWYLVPFRSFPFSLNHLLMFELWWTVVCFTVSDGSSSWVSIKYLISASGEELDVYSSQQ